MNFSSRPRARALCGEMCIPLYLNMDSVLMCVLHKLISHDIINGA